MWQEITDMMHKVTLQRKLQKFARSCIWVQQVVLRVVAHPGTGGRHEAVYHWLDSCASIDNSLITNITHVYT